MIKLKNKDIENVCGGYFTKCLFKGENPLRPLKDSRASGLLGYAVFDSHDNYIIGFCTGNLNADRKSALNYTRSCGNPLVSSVER